MSYLDGVWHRVAVLLRGDRYDEDVRRELRFHRELDALSDAGNSLGNETYYREEVRMMTFEIWADRIRQDVAYAVRGLRRAPGFTMAVVLILGLGVGVNAAMFSLLDRVFLREPAGVVHPEQLRRLYLDFQNGSGDASRLTTTHAPYPWFRAADRAADTSAGLFAYTLPESALVRDAGVRTTSQLSFVTPRYFSTLGVHLQRGRAFGGDENVIEAPTPVAVISDAFWHRVFDGKDAAIGRRLKIGAATVTIVGVAQPSFTGIDLDAVDLWMPINNFVPFNPGTEPWYTTYQSSLCIVARPKSAGAAQGLEVAAANAMRATHVQYWIDDPTLNVAAGSIILANGPMNPEKSVRVATRVAGVAFLVLLIVGANVGNMLLLRAMRRRRETAVRRALGVSRGRLLQQTMVESLALALLGTFVAVMFSIWAQAALRRLFFPTAHWAAAGIEPETIGVTFLLSLLIGFIGGLLPALGAFRPDLANSLKAGTKNSAYRSSGTRNFLLAVQIALCVVLVVGAGLFLRSLDAVQSIGTGFDAANEFFAIPTFDEPGHRAAMTAALPQVAERLRGMEGVEAVGYASAIPLYGFAFQTAFVQTRDSTFQPEGPSAPSTIVVSPGFFTATGLPLQAGRDFSPRDVLEAPPVAIVSAEMAKHFWPSQSPIGQCLFLGKRDAPCATIVGVVGDAHRIGLIESKPMQFYTPVAQNKLRTATVLAVRARTGQMTAVRRETEQLFRALLPGMTGLRTRTFEEITEPELRPWRLGATLFGALGILALIVAAIGAYAVIAYGVSQRTHEMGVRIALGAQRRDILDLVLRDGLATVVAGTLAGIAAALLLGRTVASMLFGVTAADPSVIIGTATLLCVVGTLACLIPGSRAASVDPVSALRAE